MSETNTQVGDVLFSLVVQADLPPANVVLEEIKSKGTSALKAKLEKLKLSSEKLLVADATITPVSEELRFRYPFKNLWLFEILVSGEIRFWALVSIDGRGAHFLEYPLTREDVAISLF